MMKTPKREPIYLVLSFIVLALAGFIYMTYNGRQNQAVTASNSSKTVLNSSSTSSSRKDNSQLDNLKSKLEKLAKNPTREEIDSLKQEIEQLNDGDKQALLTSLEEIETDLEKIDIAEEAVTLAENTGLPAYIEQAQAAIDEVKAETKKKELSDRLNALTAALEGQAIETSLETPAYEEPIVYYQPEQTTTYATVQPTVPAESVVLETTVTPTTTEVVVETQE